MPEPLDFEQIARRLVDVAHVDDWPACTQEAQRAAAVTAIVEQLRQVWNAALDAVDAKADECLGVGDEWTKRDIASVVKRLRAPSPAASDPHAAGPGKLSTRD